MWLNEQPLKNAPDGQPYKKDVTLRAVIKAVIEEDKKDDIPFWNFWNLNGLHEPNSKLA